MRVAAPAVAWRLRRIVAREIACREMDAAVSAIFCRESARVIFEVIEHMYRAMGCILDQAHTGFLTIG